MDSADLASVFVEMLAASRLTEPEVEQRVRDAQDPQYWRELCPDCAIESGSSPDVTRVPPPSDDELTHCVDAFRADGYFTTGEWLSGDVVARMRGAVERVKEAGWPPVFGFVYDEFWLSFRSSALQQLLTRLLGAGCRQNSVLWMYFIAPRDGASGWPPHADGNGNQRLTIWIPLTDATTDNGCIYIIPKRQMPVSLPPAYRDWTTVARPELEQLLQGTRALSARAGSVLGWSHEVVHWGSSAKGATTPRLSVAVEFIGPAEPPTDWDQPVFPFERMPSFSDRVYVIAKCLDFFQKYEPLTSRYAAVAERLIAEAGRRRGGP